MWSLSLSCSPHILLLLFSLFDTSSAAGTPLFSYAGCGVEKGCFGLADGCVESQDCEAVFSYKGIDAENYEFQVSGPYSGSDRFVAMGLNKAQARMQYGVAFACHEVDGEKQVNMYAMMAQNVDGVTLAKEEDPSYGVFDSTFYAESKTYLSVIKL